MPTIHVEKSDTAEDIARKIHATNPPKASAESALAAVYTAIEQQAGHPDANLVGLAALVNALKPRTLPTGGQVYVNNDVPGSAAARLKQIQDRT